MDRITESEELYAAARSGFKSQSSMVRQAFNSLHPELAAQVALIEREYLRFMVLKVQHKDTDDPARFSPPPAVDDFWHTHVLVS